METIEGLERKIHIITQQLGLWVQRHDPCAGQVAALSKALRRREEQLGNLQVEAVYGPCAANDRIGQGQD